MTVHASQSSPAQTDTETTSPRRARVRRLQQLVIVSAAALLSASAFAFAQRPRAEPTDVGAVKRTAHGRYLVVLAPDSMPIPLHRLHRWRVRVQDARGVSVIGTDGAPLDVRVDGGMPQHGHGLPTAPRVTGHLPDGQLLIEGMRFSMPGWWTLRVRINGAAGADSVTFNLNL